MCMLSFIINIPHSFSFLFFCNHFWIDFYQKYIYFYIFVYLYILIILLLILCFFFFFSRFYTFCLRSKRPPTQRSSLSAHRYSNNQETLDCSDTESSSCRCLSYRYFISRSRRRRSRGKFLLTVARISLNSTHPFPRSSSTFFLFLLINFRLESSTLTRLLKRRSVSNNAICYYSRIHSAQTYELWAEKWRTKRYR